MGQARELARQGRYRDADEYVAMQVERIERDKNGHRGQYDRTHPGFHLHVTTEGSGHIRDYRRETNLDSGEVTVRWTDDRGDWTRRQFVSRVDGVIVLELAAPSGSRFAPNCG